MFQERRSSDIAASPRLLISLGYSLTVAENYIRYRYVCSENCLVLAGVKSHEDIGGGNPEGQAHVTHSVDVKDVGVSALNNFIQKSVEERKEDAPRQGSMENVPREEATLESKLFAHVDETTDFLSRLDQHIFLHIRIIMSDEENHGVHYRTDNPHGFSLAVADEADDDSASGLPFLLQHTTLLALLIVTTLIVSIGCVWRKAIQEKIGICSRHKTQTALARTWLRKVKPKSG